MFNKRLLWYLFPSYLVIIVVSLLLITWHTRYEFMNFYFKRVENNLETIIKLNEDNIIKALSENNTKTLTDLSNDIAQKLLSV